MRRVAIALVCLLAGAAGASERAHVYLVIVDGLDARWATPERMPRLFALAARDPEHTSIFRTIHVVMPARTNPNHLSLLTGTWAETHGVTGNAYWSRRAGTPPGKLDAPRLFEVETLFTTIETIAPARRTVAVFGKAKLARLFAAVPGRQRAPDVLWSPEEAAAGDRDPASGYSFDAATMSALLTLVSEREPDLAVVNLADVDRTAHGFGPESPECTEAVAAADVEIDRLVGALSAAGRWQRSVLLVTADHGFDAVAPTPERPTPNIAIAPTLAADPDPHVRRVIVVGDGGVAHVYDPRARASTLGAAAPTLARVAALARRTAGVVEVLARLSVPGVPLLAETHPDWRLARHERTGDLLLVAARGHQFVDPWDEGTAGLRGNHGGPGDLAVPLVVAGGFPGLRAAPPEAAAPLAVDVAPTIAALLGVPRPRRVGGAPLAASDSGRILDVLRIRARTD
jgi:hypothetical protein